MLDLVYLSFLLHTPCSVPSLFFKFRKLKGETWKCLFINHDLRQAAQSSSRGTDPALKCILFKNAICIIPNVRLLELQHKSYEYLLRSTSHWIQWDFLPGKYVWDCSSSLIDCIAERVGSSNLQWQGNDPIGIFYCWQQLNVAHSPCVISSSGHILPMGEWNIWTKHTNKIWNKKTHNLAI